MHAGDPRELFLDCDLAAIIRKYPLKTAKIEPLRADQGLSVQESGPDKNMES
jgi:hypothetical protein